MLGMRELGLGPTGFNLSVLPSHRSAIRWMLGFMHNLVSGRSGSVEAYLFHTIQEG
jgi:hypothetical protein